MSDLTDARIDELVQWTVDSRNVDMCAIHTALRELVRRRAAINAFAETISAAVRAAERHGKGGQHVPFHGDFCSATPGVLTRLEWWARYLKGA